MADSVQLPTAEGGRASGGKPNWILLGGLGVGAVILLYMLMKGGGGSKTPAATSAGTSINAALGSIQEQNLNIMGQVSQSEARLRQQLDTDTSQIVAGQGSILGNINASDQQANSIGTRLAVLFSTGWDIFDPKQAQHWLAGDPHPGGNLDFSQYSNAVDWSTYLPGGANYVAPATA